MGFRKQIGLQVLTGTMDLDGQIKLRAISTPATPPPIGSLFLYCKIDGQTKLYYMDDAGVEHEVAVV